MVVSFEQRFTRWGSGLFQANYTYGHALDEVSNGGIGIFYLRQFHYTRKMPTIFAGATGGGIRRAPFLQCKLCLGSSV